MSVIPILRRLRQGDQEIGSRLECIVKLFRQANELAQVKVLAMQI